MKEFLNRLALWWLGGVVVDIKATDWQTAKGVWATSFLHYRPHKDRLWVDWERRTLEIEKDFKMHEASTK